MIAALLVALAGASLQGVPADSFKVVRVGEVEVVADAERLDAAIALAGIAERVTTWPGLGARSAGPMTLVLVADSAAMARWSRGRAPGWGAAVAFPQGRTIILRADLPDLPRTLRHELAHLVLRSAVRSRLPLWFDEGYATLAAGEWDRLARLELHLSVVLGGVPRLVDLDGQLRGNAQGADRAYGLAATAVTSLTERIPGRDLAPLLARLADGEEFSHAVQGATGRDISQWESQWQVETRKQFRGSLWLVAGGWWLVMAALLVVGWGFRRRRERPRREALNVGWELPPPEEPVEGKTPPPEGPIDPGRQGL